MKNVLVNKVVKIANYCFIALFVGLMFVSIGVVLNLVLSSIFNF